MLLQISVPGHDRVGAPKGIDALIWPQPSLVGHESAKSVHVGLEGWQHKVMHRLRRAVTEVQLQSAAAIQ